ncbi:MAG TPA: hypothetical protein DHW02_21270, partial [Ktedonobacter sp.]|nr:hypothetical protein [Ktedonobacter sp.]
TFKLSNTDYRKQYLYDTSLSVAMAVAGTFIVSTLTLYLSFTHILLLYIPIVLVLAVVRGLFASLLAALVASAAIVAFFIPNPFNFTFSNGEKWLSLLLLLCIAGVVGGQTTKARRLATQANRQACEMQLLYQLVEEIGNIESPEQQLQLIAEKIIHIFHRWGAIMCSFFIFTSEGEIALRADAPLSGDRPELYPGEQSLMLLTMRDKKMQILHDAQHVDITSGNHYVRFPSGELSEEHYICLIPLFRGKSAIGVLRFVTTKESSLIDKKDPASKFFQVFLDQAMSVIERTQLRAEKLRAETWRETDALRASLVHSVSHDLRTPLATIMMAASTLYQICKDQGNSTMESSAFKIEREATRLDHLVGNLLDMSQIEGNALSIDTVVYPIDSLIYETVEQMESVLQNRVKLYIPENLPPVEIEPTRIKQVLRNLLENAIRHTPSACPIEIRAHLEHEQLVVCVRDEGPGIAQSDIEHIFDKFYHVKKRKDNTSQFPGSGLGLGLAICRGLIEAHHGRIWADNHSEGGAIFSFSLPVK